MSLNVWIVSTGEPLPLSGKEGRLMRAGQLATLLAKRGHSVTWWASTFDHTQKVQLSDSQKIIQLHTNLKLVMLKGRAYSNNISIQRIGNHRDTAAAFSRATVEVAAPDIIVVCMPTIELCAAVADYAETHNVPFVIDVRDIWPDMWLDIVPAFLKPLARIFLSPYNRTLAKAVIRSAAITAVSLPAVVWARKKAGQTMATQDRVFHLSYTPPESSSKLTSEARQFWERYPSVVAPNSLVLAYIGSFMHRLYFDDVIAAARQLYQANEHDIVFVLCGRGPQSDLIDVASKELPNIIAPGWIDPSKAEILYKIAKVGLLPYPNGSDFPLLLPNKFGEYVSHGLPILSSLGGYVGDLLTQYNCGLVYPPDDGAALVECILRLKEDKPLQQTMRMGALSLAPQFDGFQVYGAFGDFIEAISSNSNSP